MTVEHVSDTARLVAVYRAMESERPDALLRDPYARRLAGDRGEDILRSLRGGRAAAWSMVAPTVVLDEMILRAVAEGADLVLNLGAGLDARPFRLELPRSLRWVEVDLPGILAYKEAQVHGERARCVRETVPLDLTDVAARRALFARLGAEARHVAVVTEGLLVYLRPDQVAGLATDLHARPTFARWFTDLGAPYVLKLMQRRYGRIAGARGTAPMYFAPAEGPAFFASYGWTPVEERSMLDEARRLRREMRFAWLLRLLAFTERRRHSFRRAALLVELGRA